MMRSFTKMIVFLSIYCASSIAHADMDKALELFRDRKFELAETEFLTLAKDNNIRAIEYLIDIYAIDEDWKKVQEWRVKAAELGDAHAQYVLGKAYRDGSIVNQDYKKAQFWFNKAAKQGEGFSLDNLGILYELGRGVEIDLPRALMYYRLCTKYGGFNHRYPNDERIEAQMTSEQIKSAEQMMVNWVNKNSPKCPKDKNC